MSNLIIFHPTISNAINPGGRARRTPIAQSAGGTGSATAVDSSPASLPASPPPGLPLGASAPSRSATSAGGAPRVSGYRRALWPVCLALLLLGGCSDEPSDGDGTSDDALTKEELAIEPPAPGETREISWDDLIPADWQPEQLMDDYDVDNLADEDPRAQELMEKLQALWAEAPVVEALNGSSVRLPGFVVPLESDASTIREFLLVPYFGACIHVPPPPANQTVLVTTPADQPYPGGLFDTVWVEGRMRVEAFSDDLGDAGYRIENARVTLYEDT